MIVSTCESWGTGGPDYSAYLDYYGGLPYISEGTVDTAGTPVLLDIRSHLKHNAHSGIILNEGSGTLYIYLSSDGETYSDVITIGDGQFLDLTKEDVYAIKLDSDTDGNQYKVVVH